MGGNQVVALGLGGDTGFGADRQRPSPAAAYPIRILYPPCIKVDFRNMKITMGMDMLSCRTPDMIIKEIWVYFLAYNLIRLLMTQAGIAYPLTPRHISFKHTIQIWIAWRSSGMGCQANVLFALIAQRQVGNRSGRVKPRAMKRRTKAFPWLFVPRAQAQSNIRRNGHP